MKYLYGASGHAKVVVDVIRSKNNSALKGIFDDNLSEIFISDLEFLGPFDSKKLNKSDELLISIGDNKIRKKITERLETNYFTAIHNNSIISNSSLIQAGTVVMANTTINSSVQIGKHCIINTASVIEHDCVVEDFVHVSPNATLTGNVKVGEGTQIGAGAVILPNINIGKWCKIGAGTIVLKDVPDNSVMVGNPGRILKK